MAAFAAKWAAKLGPKLEKLAQHADTIESVATLALGSGSETTANTGNQYVTTPSYAPSYVPSYSSGTSLTTYLLFGDIIFLLVGVILLVSSNSACKTDSESVSCKGYKNWGIAFTVICSIGFVVLLFFKFK
jgi:hypothetical protein